MHTSSIPLILPRGPSQFVSILKTKETEYNVLHVHVHRYMMNGKTENSMGFFKTNKIIIILENIRGLSGKFADTANKTRNMYPRLKKFCINYQALIILNMTHCF